MSKILRYITISLLLAVAGYWGYIRFSAPSKGELAPDFAATTSDGASFLLSETRGNYVLLNFWASWCEPCRREIPQLIALKKKHGDQLTIVSIALEKDLQAGERMAEQARLNWKYQIIEESSFVMMADLAQLYGVTEIPTLFLIDPKGVLLGSPTIDEVSAWISSP